MNDKQTSLGGDRKVVAMFDRIAHRYDLLNRLLSVGTDLVWRRRALQLADVREEQRWLDLAAGSGDMTAEGLRRAPRSRWIAVDPSDALLRRFVRRPELMGVPALRAVGEAIPVAAGSVQGVTVAFGLRNFADPDEGLREIRRVLAPGGRLVLLEFHGQEGRRWGAPLVRFYLERVIPFVGGIVSGDREAYGWLAGSSRRFWSAVELVDHLRSAGLNMVLQRTWMMGAVTLTIAEAS